jgi:hypothetical protein
MIFVVLAAGLEVVPFPKHDHMSFSAPSLVVPPEDTLAVGPQAPAVGQLYPS